MAVVETDSVAVSEWFGRQLDERRVLARAYSELLLHGRRNPIHMQARAWRNADRRKRSLQIVVYPSPLIFNPAFEFRPDARARRGRRRFFEIPQIGY